MGYGPRTTGCIRHVRSIDDIEALERSPYDELIPAQSVYEVFANTAQLHGDRLALTVLRSANPHDVGIALTHRQLFGEITRAANLFASLGVGRTDVVTFVSKTYPLSLPLIFGAETAGIASCINPMLTGDVIASLLNAEKAKILVCPAEDLDAELFAKLTKVIPEVPSLKMVLTLGARSPSNGIYRSVEAALEGVNAERLEFVEQPSRETVAALFHTGGTTGLPKLVAHTHGNQIHAAWSFAQIFGITEHDVGMNGLPLFHVGGTSTWGLALLGAGAHVVVVGPVGYRDPAVVQNVWAIASHYKATMTGSVPTTIGVMADVDTDGADLSTLRMAQTGGASLTASVAARYEARAGIPLLEQYGMTESVATITSTPFYGQHVRGSVGLRCPFSELRIVKNGAAEPLVDCAPGEVGAVVCRGPQVVRGYVDERHTAESFTTSGWLITGDLGYLREDSMLVLTGRLKDLIIRGGHNIDPATIEEIAVGHPGVAACAAVGMPDAYAGEVPVLFVVPRKNTEVTDAELLNFIQLRIGDPPAKPRHVFFIEALPVTSVGKIFKPDLRSQATLEKVKLTVKALPDSPELSSAKCIQASGQLTVEVALVTDRAEGERELFEEALHKAMADLPFTVEVIWLY